MQRRIYFGTRDIMQWVPAPRISYPRSLNGWMYESNYLNGGGNSKKSAAGHRVYEFEWSLKSGEDINVVHAYAEGAYGRGLIYFLDPQAMKYNVLPQAIAHPALACHGGPNLAGQGADKPVVEETPANTNGYPVESAEYTLTGTETPLELWIPVPDGYTLHIGAHGSATGSAAVEVEPDGGSASDLTLLGVDTTTRTNYTETGPSGVTLRLTGTGTITLSGLIAQVLPTGQSVEPGGWIIGKGNSGCNFLGFADDSLYSSALDLQSTSATFKEVGLWQK